MAAFRVPVLILLLAVLVALAPPAVASVKGAPSADPSTTLVVIDTPRGGISGTQLFVSGWAADPRSLGGTGVDRVEVYLDGERDSGGTYLGRATYGLSRPDVAAHLGGSRFALSGYALVAAATPGPHTVYVYARSSDTPGDQGWAPAKTAAVLVGPGPGGPDPAAALAGLPGIPGVPPLGATSGAVTVRQAGISGSVTYDLPFPGVGPYYPPGPADTGGPLYAPAYLGAGLYNGVLPFPDYPPYYWYGAGWVPPGFDFSYGYGYDFYSPGYLFHARYGRLFDSFYPGRSYRYPLYCPVFSYTFC